jgi:hypothetical protein
MGRLSVVSIHHFASPEEAKALTLSHASLVMRVLFLEAHRAEPSNTAWTTTKPFDARSPSHRLTDETRPGTSAEPEMLFAGLCLEIC